jgi:hypothetical protein
MLDGIIICDTNGKVIYSKQTTNSPLKSNKVSNVEWASAIIKYSLNPSLQNPVEGQFRAINHKNRIIVYNTLDGIFYFAVGDEQLGELGCKIISIFLFDNFSLFSS